MTDPFNIFVFSLYVILGIVFAVKYVISKINLKREIRKSKPSNNTIMVSTPFYLIRSQYFPDDLTYNAFFINAHMEEAFNMFIKLIPSIIETLTKADKRILTLKPLIEDTTTSEEEIREEITRIDHILDELIKVSHSMIEKLEEVITKDRSDPSPTWMDPEVIQVYTEMVNTLTELTNNHSIINFEIHNKLAPKYPDLVEPFRIIAGKITYIFFISLISYSSKLDENLFAYNHKSSKQ